MINIIKKRKKSYNLRWLINSSLVTILIVSIFLFSKIFVDTPIQKLELVGVFQRVNPIQVEEIFSQALGKGFFSIEIRSLEKDLEKLNWVDNVEIARRWPNKISVRIYEQVPSAIWNNDSLLNSRGELFLSRKNYNFPELPNLFGPNGSELKIAKKYFELKDFLEKANLDLEFISIDERSSWIISFNGGPKIRLGRKDIDSRTIRLFDLVIPNFKNDLSHISYIDMRYESGFSVGWESTQVNHLAKF